MGSARGDGALQGLQVPRSEGRLGTGTGTVVLVPVTAEVRTPDARFSAPPGNRAEPCAWRGGGRVSCSSSRGLALRRKLPGPQGSPAGHGSCVAVLVSLLSGLRGCCYKVPHAGSVKQQKNLSSHSAGGQASEVRVSAGWAPCPGSREGPPCPSGFGGSVWLQPITLALPHLPHD